MIIKKIFKKEVNIATRTISNTGGNYNATAAWVEGIVPTSADAVVATATSGQLTVNVASAASTFTFTNYVNTLTMNDVWTVSGTGTQTFVNAMTIAGSSNIALRGSGATIVTNGKTIPNLSITGNKTVSDTLNIVNLTTSTNAVTWSGTQTINLSGNGVFSASVVGTNGTGITFNLTGTGTLSGIIGFKETNINTAGTITLVNNATQGFSIQIRPTTSGSSVSFNYISGTIAGTKTLSITGGAFGGSGLALISLNLGGMTWTEIQITYVSNLIVLLTMTLNSDLNFTGDLSLASVSSFSYPVIINGTGKLNGGRLLLNTGINRNVSPFIFSNTLRFGSTASHILTTILSGSQIEYPNTISSQTASTTAYLSVSGTQSSIQNTNFTDIDATGGPIQTFRSTLTRTTEITNFTQYGGGGGGTVAFTFLN